MNRIIVTSLCLLGILTEAAGINSWTPTGLEAFNYASVYHISQDGDGAIWLHTERGIYRYNGHTVESRSYPLPWSHAATQDDDYFRIVTVSGDIMSFSRSSISSQTVSFPEKILSGDPVATFNGSIFAGSEHNLFVMGADGLVSTYLLPEGVKASVLLPLSASSCLIGTTSEGIYLFDAGHFDCLHAGSTAVKSLFRAADGTIWAGFLEGGFVSFDPHTFHIGCKYVSCDGKALKDVRSFASDLHGNLFIGTANGLYKLDSGGLLQEELLGGAYGRPVCNVFVDRDGNLWTGTYYNGVFFSNIESFPFESMVSAPSLLIIRGMVEDRFARVWVTTDGYGLFRFDPGTKRFFLVPGTEGIKFQCAFYDKQTDCLWAGEFQKGLIAFNTGTGSLRKIAFGTEDGDRIQNRENITVIKRLGKKLALGASSGLFLFDPETESFISHKVAGYDNSVYDVETAPDGTLMVAGIGLYALDPETGLHPMDVGDEGRWIWNAACYDINYDVQGRLWVAFSRRGAGLLEGGAIKHFTASSSGLSDNYCSCVIPRSDGSVLVVSSSGISIIHPEEKQCFIFDKNNGLSIGPGRVCSALQRSDGTIWIGGNDGIIAIPDSLPDLYPAHFQIALDKIHVNGERFDQDPTLPYLSSVILDHTQTNLSFEVTDYDYSKTTQTSFWHKLDGYDKDWVPFNIQDLVSYMNMKPGHYVFRVRAQRRGGAQTAEASVKIRIRPAWYATLAAKILFLLLGAGIVYIILRSAYSRTVLTEKLRLKERETEDQTRFFVNLSYKLRTPVNLIIGQMEKFFRDFGSRTAGVEDLENVYGKAKQMRTMISDYVDSQNDDLGKHNEDERMSLAYKNAKFLNAAIGAVERHLYSKDLNVTTLCSELNVGKTTLTERLKEVSGLTPREFIEDIRLKHAAQMLTDGVYRVSEVADNLAFSSQKYFAQRFKLKYGVTPRDYKGRKTDLSQQ